MAAMNSASAQEERLRFAFTDCLRQVLDDPGLVQHQFQRADEAAAVALGNGQLLISVKRADLLDDEAMDALHRLDGQQAWVLAQVARWVAEQHNDQLVAANAWKHLSAACSLLNWPDMAIHCLKQTQANAAAIGRAREAEIAQEVIDRMTEGIKSTGYTGPQPRKPEERRLLSPLNPVMIEATRTLFELVANRTSDSVETSAPFIDRRLQDIIGDNVAVLRDVDVDYWLERAQHSPGEEEVDDALFRWITAHVARWMARHQSCGPQEADAWEIIARTAERMGWREEAGEAWRAAQIRSAEAGNHDEAQRRGREAQRYGPRLSDSHPAGQHQALELTQIIGDCLARRLGGDMAAAMPEALTRAANVLLDGAPLLATAEDAKLTLSLIPRLREFGETVTSQGSALTAAIISEWVGEAELGEFAWWQAGMSARLLEWHEEAIAYLDRAIKSLRARAGNDAELMDLFATIFTERALVHFDRGEHEESLVDAQEAVNLREPLAENSPRYIRDMLLSLTNIAIELRHVGRFGDALKRADQAIDLANCHIGSQPSRVLDRLVSALSVKVNALQGLKQPGEIVSCCDRILQLCDQLEAGAPDAGPVERVREWRSEALVNRALALQSPE